MLLWLIVFLCKVAAYPAQNFQYIARLDSARIALARVSNRLETFVAAFFANYLDQWGKGLGVFSQRFFDEPLLMERYFCPEYIGFFGPRGDINDRGSIIRKGQQQAFEQC